MSEALAMPSPAERGGRIVRGPSRSERDGEQALKLELFIEDPEMLAELRERQDGEERRRYALDALRIGILALKQARGRLDADAVEHAGEKLLAGLERRLGEHQNAVNQHLAQTLRHYFDPESGHLHQRLERLVRKDGELERVLSRQIGEEDSLLEKTLRGHFGPESPLMRVLSPDDSRGLMKALTGLLDEALRGQRERILKEFSLDSDDSALSRLVGELNRSHGRVVEEFDLNNEDSALSRLVQRVERAQRQISSEFTLDEETSALARLRGEVLKVLEEHREANARFQEHVKEALARTDARKEERQRSTRHGEHFEEALVRFFTERCQRTGDVVRATGNSTGLIANCKVGDGVIELGPEHAAPGALIVVEAKERVRFDLSKALEEISVARKNRSAEVGIFVYSRAYAPEGLDPIGRYGSDVVVVWDNEDPGTDVYLDAGLSIARALATRAARREEAGAADFQELERAIRRIEKLGEGIDEIRTSTETIQKRSEKILARARIMRETLEKQVAVLLEKTEIVRDGS